MATVFSEGFESGSNGAAITTSNTTYSLVNGTGTTVFDGTYFVAGSLSAKLTPTGTNTINLREIFSSVSGRYFRRFFRVNALPLNTTILTIMRIRLSGIGTLGQVVLNPNGTIQIRDNNTAVATSTSKVSLNAWFRIEWHVDGIGATQNCQIFLSSNYNGTTPTETITGSYSGGNFDRIEDGIGAANYPGTLWLDEADDDDTTWPGSVVGANQPPTASAGSNQTVISQQVVTLDGTGSNDIDGTIASYSWTQLSGAAVTLSDPTIPQPTFSAPTISGSSTTLSFGLIVTDNLGAQSAQSTVTITVNPPAATAFSEDFENGTNGATVTTTNTAYSTINGSATFDDAVSVSGTFSANFTVAATAVTFSQNLPSAATTRYLRRYFLLSSLPPGAGLTILRLRTTGAAVAQVFLNGNGTIQIRDGNTTVVATSTSALTPGTWFRLEWKVDGTTTNTQTLQVYLLGNYNGTTPDETISGAYTSGSFNRIDDGPGSATFTGTVWLDGVADDTGAFVGPMVGANLAPTADAGSDQTVASSSPVMLDATDSDDSDGAIVGFSWTQSSGSRVLLSSSTIVQPTFTSPNVGGTLVFSVIAIDNQGAGSNPATVNIIVNAPTAAFNESFENGPNGATITSSNVSYDTINGIATFDNSTTAAGSLSAKMIGTGTSATTLRETLSANATSRYMRRYFRVSALPTGSGVLDCMRLRLINVTTGQVVLIANGQLQIRDGNTVVASSVSSVLPNTWIRLEWFVDGTTTNTQTLRVYMASLLNSATTPTETLTGSYTSGAFNHIEDGIGVTNYSGTLWLDEAQDQLNSWPGPAAGVNQPPTIDAGPDQSVLPGDTITLDGTGSSDPDGTIATYAWTQLSGSSVTLSSTSAAKPTFTAPTLANGGSLVFSLTVTDNSGATSQLDMVTVTVQPINEFVLRSGSWQVGPPNIL